ncbi:Glutathione S-transferase [Phytophthora megakarya]|uniref:Glutathione S-transferase n=1 Tax=Phytophthora megakarya TaxID=4795 RepID=A0A225WBN1_9STRA|nr:Glutathione S-transferase [Phytophthora megakarya]
MSGRPRGANYRAAEDNALCKALIEGSNDGGTDINQCGDQFYGRIKLVLDDLGEGRQNKVQDRSETSLSSRFSTISASVSKFVGCHCGGAGSAKFLRMLDPACHCAQDTDYRRGYSC